MEPEKEAKGGQAVPTGLAGVRVHECGSLEHSGTSSYIKSVRQTLKIGGMQVKQEASVGGGEVGTRREPG